MFRGVPVCGHSVVVEREGAGNVHSVDGQLSAGIGFDLASTTPRLGADHALAVLRHGHPYGYTRSDVVAAFNALASPVSSGHERRSHG